ncbi:uncharacterized protein LOC116006597 isoform X1 [Ipomoea triloba]|uniref:uncharacterized protein LOC116006597 isoform X1 n=1 Tax=Ipomoea triloba TaxID=35885 RepID=UPI00125E6DA2|nr:uncharacterized protein LOC116006597 isoform X1 [Ipomoea triloba]GLL38222.1 uncharacterized protein LOC109191498 isoform X1 [Ipomoea trifida]GMD44367.1 uncharacterized protein LOC109191498 isoform X1 [Ipomoea batatas]
MATLPRSTSSSFLFQQFRIRAGGITMVKPSLSLNSKTKKANLSATKNERIKLPTYSNGSQEAFHISKFLSHPSGIEAILNKRALQSLQSLNSNLYRCTLPQIQFLNFEVAPVLILQVTSSSEDCRVEMLSCKFEGSEVVERQNEHFSASMRNYITWETIDSEPFLNIDVKLDLSLEIYTQPLTLLPVSAVERPGNIMMQALVDRLVPLLLQQLLHDYDQWVRTQHLP